MQIVQHWGYERVPGRYDKLASMSELICMQVDPICMQVYPNEVSRAQAIC